MDNYLILIVEDELVTKTVLRNIFEAEGYDVIEASNGDEMNEVLTNNKVSLIIMDINLPGKNGLLLARELKKKYNNKSNIGLVFLTGRDNDIDKILGLEIGADDYITKPFNPRELAIRTRNLLARTSSVKQSSDDEDEVEKVNYYKFEGWTLDVNSHMLIAPDNKSYRLPKSEFRAMHFFCSNPKKIHSRETLLEKMTGRQFKPNDRSVDVTIRRLRQYFNTHSPGLDVITTIHGEGYRFSIPIEGVE